LKALVLSANWEPKKEYKLTKKEQNAKVALNGSCVWKNPSARIEEVKQPEIEPDEVLIRVKACGVCGSDVHMLEVDEDGYMLFPGPAKLPCIIGHEFSGVVEEIGKEVKSISRGDMVTCEEMNWCGRCIPCRAGMFNQCNNLEEIGFTINGAFAEFIVVKEKYCYKIDDLAERYADAEKAYEAGALVEPTSVAYNGMFTRAGGFKPGGHVVIFGAGPIGLACVTLARACGAAKIIVFEKGEKRRQLAKKIGADYVWDPSSLEKERSSPHEAVMEVTRGLGASMLIEAAGNTLKTIPEMEKSMTIDGKILQIGMVAGKTPFDLLVYQNLGAHFHGTRGHAGHDNFPSVIRLMAAGRIDMTKIVTNRFPLNKAVDAINASRTLNEGKVLVKP